jgi:hypothetical protein
VLGLTLLLMSLVWGQTAVFQSDSELVFLLTGGSAVGLACFGGAIVSGVITPQSIPDDELSPLATRLLVVCASIGLFAILLIYALVLT